MTLGDRYGGEENKLSDLHQRIADLVDQYELARDSGVTLTVEELCSSNPELMSPLRAAIRRLDVVDCFLDTVPTLPIPDRIGEFWVINAIGAGATGMVFRCRQSNPDRHVAVKVLKPNLGADEQQTRFRRELAAFSAIHDDGIVSIWQTGIMDWCGVRCLWIAMELLDNGNICQFIRRESLGEHDVLMLFEAMCRTMRAAHRVGVLHRDIKPSNILVSHDRQPHFVDFGIAKLTNSNAGFERTATGATSAQGTAAWMAPELLEGNQSVQSDIRSEIFSLGVVLYEMLSGQHPFGANDLTIPQVAARIVQSKGASLEDACPNASKDLQAFVGRMLKRNPAERYQTLDEVLEDLGRLQRGEFIRSRIVPLPERIFRWGLQHRIQVIATGVVVVSSIISFATIVSTSRQLIRKNAELQTNSHQLTQTLQLRDRSIAAGKLRTLASAVETSPTSVQRVLHDHSQFPAESRGFAWQLLNRISTTKSDVIPYNFGKVERVRFDPTGQFLIVMSQPDLLAVTDLKTGTTAPISVPVYAQSLIFPHAMGDRVVAFAVSEDRQFIKIRLPDGADIQRYETPPDITSRYTVSNDGRFIAGANREQRPFLINTETGEILIGQELLQDRLASLWFTHNNSKLHCVDRGFNWYQFETGRLRLEGKELLAAPSNQGLEAACFSSEMADGSQLAFSTGAGRVRVRRFDAGATTPILDDFQVSGGRLRELHSLPPFEIMTVQDTVWLHNVFETKPPRSFSDFVESPTSADASRDGKRLAIGTAEGQVVIVDRQLPSAEDSFCQMFSGEQDRDYGFSSRLLRTGSNGRIISGHYGGWLSIVDETSLEILQAFKSCQGPIKSIAWDNSSQLVAVGSAGDQAEIAIYRLTADHRFTTQVGDKFIDLPPRVTSILIGSDVVEVFYSETAEHLCVCLRNGFYKVFDTNDWHEIAARQIVAGGLSSAAMLQNRVVVGDTTGAITVIDAISGAELNRWQAHQENITAVTFNDNGSNIYSGTRSGEMLVWNDTGQKICKPIGHSGPVTVLKLASDGRTLVSGSGDRRLLFWDATTGDLQFELKGHGDYVTDFEFVAENHSLISSAKDGSLRKWSGKQP